MCAPGVADARIDDLCAPLGIELPEEARLWWRWRNGRADSHRDGCWLTRSREHVAIELTVAAAASMLEMERDNGPGSIPGAGLIQLVSGEPVIMFDPNVERDAPAPVFTLTEWGLQPQLASIGSLVDQWCWLYEQGICRRASSGEWEIEGWEGVPQESRDAQLWI